MAKKNSNSGDSIKYKSGIFKILKESPTPEDIQICFKGKEYFTDSDIEDLFGKDKKIVTDLSLKKLASQKIIREENNRYYFC